MLMLSVPIPPCLLFLPSFVIARDGLPFFEWFPPPYSLIFFWPHPTKLFSSVPQYLKNEAKLKSWSQQCLFGGLFFYHQVLKFHSKMLFLNWQLQWPTCLESTLVDLVFQIIEGIIAVLSYCSSLCKRLVRNVYCYFIYNNEGDIEC